MVIQCQEVSSQNIHASNIKQTQYVVVMDYSHTYVTIIKEKEAMNLRGSEYGRSWREKGKER